MKKSIRLALLAGACFLGLAVAAPAFSAYDPALIMEQSSYKLGGATTADVFIAIDPDADPTAQLTDLLAGRLQRQPDGGARHEDRQRRRPREGEGARRRAADARRQRARRRPGRPGDPGGRDPVHRERPTHAAIWVLNTSLQGQTVAIPVFVDQVGPLVVQTGLPALAGRSRGDRAGRSSARSSCAADFTIKNVFTNAGTNGDYEWAGIFTPYTPGTATPNPAGTLECAHARRAALVADAQAQGEGEAGLQARRPAEGRRRRPEGRQLDLYGGKKAGPARTPSPAGPASARLSAKLPSSGKYTIARPNVKFATFFQTRFENYTTRCTGPSPSGLPVPCHDERIAADDEQPGQGPEAEAQEKKH